MSEQKPDSPTQDARPQTSNGCSTASHGLTNDDIADDVRALSTLGNDTRYEALRLIAEADEDLCVCEIEPALGVSQSAVSQALSKLFSAGLVERRKEGRWRYYTATPRAERLLDVLDETRP
ncbi:winged helix-turn-helix transcriptional regulator [Natronomonas halophila]|uniref:ArsR/SmtB family transcription factor n=1 Tax=Natronomonas halophila TaxID=2747817 RepID=UPI0015B5C7B0|nr:metalloregulator ArsR/SmtB family transcription factor [Natronomonas halophila]QLD86353.1 winged helix-turn-helix transcriptional regulator [Natronomonas halophila]